MATHTDMPASAQTPAAAAAVADEPASTFAGRLVARHFLAQDRRPRSLRAVELSELDCEARALLLTDGTVTRALEARALRPARAYVRDEHERTVPDELAPLLDLPAGTRARLRRTTIHVGGDEQPAIYAESVIVPERLPRWFDTALAASKRGLGEAIASGTLETRRELLWFGLSVGPRWFSEQAESIPVLTRAYRVYLEARATMLIQEAFVMRHQKDRWCLPA